MQAKHNHTTNHVNDWQTIWRGIPACASANLHQNWLQAAVHVPQEWIRIGLDLIDHCVIHRNRGVLPFRILAWRNPPLWHLPQRASKPSEMVGALKKVPKPEPA